MNDLIALEDTAGPDLVMGWAADLRKGEYGFVPAVTYALEQFQKKNNKPVYRLISFVKGKGFDNGDEKALKLVTDGDNGVRLKEYDVPLKRMLDALLVGVSFKFKEDKKTGKMKLAATVSGNGGVNVDALDRLKATLAHHNGRVSVRGDTFKVMFPPVPKAKSSVKADTKDQSIAKADKLAKDRTAEDLVVILANKRAELAALEALVSHNQKVAAE